MYYFRYHVKPTNHNPGGFGIAGAVANVFVAMVDPFAAESREGP